MISKVKIIIIYWVVLIVIGGALILLNIPQFLSKRILGIYFLIGVATSFKYKIPIFQKGNFSDKIDSQDKYVFSNISNVGIMIFALYLLFS